MLQLARVSPPERAFLLLEEARRIAPASAAVASELARTWLAIGRPAEALPEFGRALALAPNDPQALNNRGVALLALGQTEAARQDFERALGRDPCSFDARLNLLRLGVRTPDPSGCRYTADQRRALELTTVR
jgi:Flp pilus assembly protein TadD